MMNEMILLGAAACGTAGKCPGHALVALGATFVAGLAIGMFFGKRSAKKGKKCACAKATPRREREARPTETRVPIPAGSVEIYVGNLSYDLTEEILRKEFEAFGTVDTARVVLNRFNGKSKGFGFVVMPNRPEAEKAIAAMSEKEVLGRKMRVNEAKNTIKE